MRFSSIASDTTCFSSDAGFARGSGLADLVVGRAQALLRRTRSLPPRFDVFNDDLAGSTCIEASDSLLYFQSVLSDPSERDALREQLKGEQGSENFEFLLAFRGFEEARNPLQRFQLLSHIVHSFVQERAARQVRLTDECRQQLILELSRWSDAGRVPVGVQLASLEAAAAEINMCIVAVSQEPFGRAQPRGRVSHKNSWGDTLMQFD